MEHRVAFIINPISGAKNKSHLPAQIKSLAASHKIAVDIFFTEQVNHASELTQELIEKGYQRIVAVGGDGTINEVASQLVDQKVELGIVPQGSGNGLARHLKIPMNTKKAILAALTHSSECIDAAYINNTPFFCTAGVGFDALIGNKFAESKSRGLKTYAAISTKEFMRYKPQQYKIEVDGKEYAREAFLITVANASQYGNNAYIAPSAELQDGLLNVVIVSHLSLAAGPMFAIRMFTKMLESSRKVETFTGKVIRVTREVDNDYIHYDGEPGRMGKVLEFRVKPSSLKVVF